MIAERPSDRASSRSAPYDFERLERSVEILLKEHERLSAEREALLEELVDREHRISTLEAKLVSEEARRQSSVEHVDRILERLQAVEVQMLASEAASDSEGR